MFTPTNTILDQGMSTNDPIQKHQEIYQLWQNNKSSSSRLMGSGTRIQGSVTRVATLYRISSDIIKKFGKHIYREHLFFLLEDNGALK